MATSRTGTGVWKRRRDQVLAIAQARGQTTCAIATCAKWLAYGTHGQHDSPEVDHIEDYVETKEIAPPVDKLRVICRECNGKGGGKTGARRKGTSKELRVSQEW